MCFQERITQTARLLMQPAWRRRVKTGAPDLSEDTGWDLWQRFEGADRGEGAIGHQGMDMGVPVRQLAESLQGGDHPGLEAVPAQRCRVGVADGLPGEQRQRLRQEKATKRSCPHFGQCPRAKPSRRSPHLR